MKLEELDYSEVEARVLAHMKEGELKGRRRFVSYGTTTGRFKPNSPEAQFKLPKVR